MFYTSIKTFTRTHPTIEIANVNFFYDDIAYALQNTKKRTYFVCSFNKLDDS